MVSATEKAKLGEGRRGWVANLNWVVRVVIIGMMIFNKGLEGSEEVSYMDIGRRAFWTENNRVVRRECAWF